MQGLPPRRRHPLALGAFIVSAAAVPGLLLSVFLTLVRLGAASRCDFALLAACDGECSRVLTSGPATLFGAPISIFATAYFGVVLCLGLSLLWRPARTTELARPLLLLFAGAGLLVILGLAAYAVAVLGSFCRFCFITYGLTLLVALGASLLHSEGYRASLRALVSRRFLGSPGVHIALTAWMAAVSLQMLGYRMNEAFTPSQRCLVRGELPETPLRDLNAQRPRVEIALFLDLACPHCRDELTSWRSQIAGRADLQLAFYFYTRAGDCVPGAAKSNLAAERNDSCRAAQAVLCADALVPGAGVRLLDPLFALQDGSSPYFTLPRLAEAARAAGLPGLPTDMSDPKALAHPFFTCIEGGERLPAIREHAEYALHNGLTTPSAVFTFFDRSGAPRPRKFKIIGRRQLGDLDVHLREAEAFARSEPLTPAI